MKTLLLLIAACYSSILFAQELEIIIKEPLPYLLSQDINIEIYLTNPTPKPITYFDSRGPSWDSFKETWEMKAIDKMVEILPLNGAYNNNFPDSTIITMQPDDTNLIRTHVINLKTVGLYSLTYTQEQASEFVKREFADRTVSDSLINTITPFKVTKNIKFEVFKQYDTTINKLITMTWEEWKEYRPVKLKSRKNHFDDLNTALRHPQEVYSLTLYCDALTSDDLKRIARLKNLRALTLRNYTLDYFPVELTELNLYELTLLPKNETVVSFPSGLSKNNTLRELTAKFYAGVPTEVLNQKDLVYLDISDCPIMTLPSLDSLQHLEVLIADNAQLNTLKNVGFNHLLKLKEVDFSGNKAIDDLTPILDCTNLEFLVINRTSIQTLPDEIEKLKKLKRLSISNGLNTISDSIGKLDDMRYLSLGGNRNLAYLPNSILNMKKLLHLDISNTKIEQLPEGVADLPLEKVMIYGTNCNITKDYKELKKRLNENFKE